MNKVIGILVFGMLFIACQTEKSGNQVILKLGAYTVPKEAYEKEIIPAFQKYWFAKTGQTVKFEESYMASGAQSRAIVGGFDADIAALSLEKDIVRLCEAGLVTHDWKQAAYGGMVTRSVVAVAYRDGNPKQIHDWIDMMRPGVEVMYPSPKTSGGAMWDVAAIYGAGLKISETETGTKDPIVARTMLKAIQQNVKVMNNSGRASVTTFENGVGDVLVTYENELYLRKIQGRGMPFFVPEATILIENPIALVDQNITKHNNREVAEAFVDFLLQKNAQRAFAQYGFRPVDAGVAEEFKNKYPAPSYLFDIDYLGGWDTVGKKIFGPDGLWTAIMEELANEN